MNFHEGFRPAKFFHCETCEKRFARKNDLKRHIMIVHIEKDYDCSQCGKTYGRKAARDRHIQVAHRKFACSDCDKGFHRSGDLNRHTINVYMFVLYITTS